MLWDLQEMRAAVVIEDGHGIEVERFRTGVRQTCEAHIGEPRHFEQANTLNTFASI